VVLLPVGMLIDKCQCCITDRSICTSVLLRNIRIVYGIQCHQACVFAAVRLPWFMGTEYRQNFISKILFSYPLCILCFYTLWLNYGYGIWSAW